MSGDTTGFAPRRRAAVALAILVVVLAALPLVANAYLVSVLVVVLFAAYFGQAWNIMMGFAGQLSLGHALYLGLGGYVSGALFVHIGLSPWLGALAGMAAAGAAGAVVAGLSFRFGVTGIYFALLTIAFAEFARILFGQLAWFGGTAGLFLPVANLAHDDLLQLRGSSRMFYYVLLGLTLAVLALSRLLLRWRIGYYWRAIREDQQAAAALGIDVFRYKLLAVVISAMLTALGGTLAAFYDNNLYPDTEFAIGRSVELITAPIVGGLGTLFGPLVGAVLLTVLGEAMTELSATLGINGLKQWLYGAVLLAIIVAQPAGVWPWLRGRLGLKGDR